MYWEYFNLNSNPFGITPDPKFLYLSVAHSTAIEWMKMAIEQHEFGLITGEVGSGKTLLSRYLIDSLPEENYKICWIVNSNVSASQFLKEIYMQLFEEDAPRMRADIVKKLQEGLTDLYMKNIFPVVFIDEAQVISGKKVFEELRMLCNYQTDDQNLISVIMIGQPELAAKLKNKAYRAFLQRIRYTVTLNPLSEEETGEYLRHRLSICGSNGKEIFTDGAIKLIYEITGGYPRPINHLASFSMMEAMSGESDAVTDENVKSAAKSVLYLEDKVED